MRTKGRLTTGRLRSAAAWCVWSVCWLLHGQEKPVGRDPVVLDHVVAVINGSVILQSDIDEEIGYGFLQPFAVNPARNTPQRALQRLIDRDLVEQQMEVAQGVQEPTKQEVEDGLRELREEIPECAHYHCETDAGWQAFLKTKGLTPQQVEAHWKKRMTLLAFIQSRFGGGVRITPQQIEDYYKNSLVPQYRNQPVQPPPLKVVSNRIREILLQRQISSLLREWLQSLKTEGSVSILDPAYGQVGTTGEGEDAGGDS